MKILTALIVAGFLSSVSYASDFQQKADSASAEQAKVETVSTDAKAPLPKGELVTSEVEVMGAGGGKPVHCGSCWAFSP